MVQNKHQIFQPHWQAVYHYGFGSQAREIANSHSVGDSYIDNSYFFAFTKFIANEAKSHRTPINQPEATKLNGSQQPLTPSFLFLLRLIHSPYENF